ncbi:trypsin [Bactrocera dorsalis]|uniref:Trypsin n=1 Tax=Bactrocera dorsalis TaxID=27457 RepID=A0A8N4L349_BACDO|nr:trypsin [Bactrocera dorsalis]
MKMWQNFWLQTIGCLFVTLLLAHSSYAGSVSVHSKNTHPVLTEYDSKIFGGSPVAITSAPWQVSVRLLLFEIQLGQGHICGGAVITSRLIITAAHCLIYPNTTQPIYRLPSEFTVVMGSIYLEEVTPYTLQYNVQQLVPHPEFSLTPLQNDLALLFIDGKIPANYPTVASIAINQMAVDAGVNCSVTGWSIVAKGVNWPVLLAAVLPVISTQQCNSSYSGQISAGMICAGNQSNNGTNAFQGGSGGPLVCNGKLSGIVSWDSGYPEVCTNLSAYYNWITMTNSTFNYDYYGGAMGLHLGAQQMVLGILCLLVTLFLSQAAFIK